MLGGLAISFRGQRSRCRLWERTMEFRIRVWDFTCGICYSLLRRLVFHQLHLARSFPNHLLFSRPFLKVLVLLQPPYNCNLRNPLPNATSKSRKRPRLMIQPLWLTCDVVALGHDLHDADRLVLLDLVGLVLGLAVRLVVRGADLGADGLVAALPHDGGVAHVHRLVEGLETPKEKGSHFAGRKAQPVNIIPTLGHIWHWSVHMTTPIHVQLIVSTSSTVGTLLYSFIWKEGILFGYPQCL